jgi:hypothetical protein
MPKNEALGKAILDLADTIDKTLGGEEPPGDDEDD